MFRASRFQFASVCGATSKRDLGGISAILNSATRSDINFIPISQCYSCNYDLPASLPSSSSSAPDVAPLPISRGGRNYLASKPRVSECFRSPDGNRSAVPAFPTCVSKSRDRSRTRLAAISFRMNIPLLFLRAPTGTLVERRLASFRREPGPGNPEKPGLRVRQRECAPKG